MPKVVKIKNHFFIHAFLLVSSSYIKEILRIFCEVLRYINIYKKDETHLGQEWTELSLQT